MNTYRARMDRDRLPRTRSGVPTSDISGLPPFTADFQDLPRPIRVAMNGLGLVTTLVFLALCGRVDIVALGIAHLFGGIVTRAREWVKKVVSTDVK